MYNTDLQKLIVRTPLLPFYNPDSNCKIYLKPENLQLFGSYKIRGIVSVVNESDHSLLSGGLSVASAGNMAQAVAFLASKLGISCQVYLPNSAPQTKKDAIKKLKAEIIELPYDEIWKIVQGKIINLNNSLFIHPVYNELLLNGYSTIAKEIIEDLPDLDAIVIPFGVGGLSLGISKLIKQFNPRIAIYTCEPETASPLKVSLLAKKPMSIVRTSSFVDAIGTPEVLPQVFHQIQPLITDSIVMTLDEIRHAIKYLFLKNKLLVEGAAGCSLGAALQLAKLGKHKKIVCILSGGNIDADVFKNLITQ